VFSQTLAESVAVISAAELEAGWVPGHKAGYHRSSGMAMLSELVRRSDGREFAVHLNRRIDSTGASPSDHPPGGSGDDEQEERDAAAEQADHHPGGVRDDPAVRATRTVSSRSGEMLAKATAP